VRALLSRMLGSLGLEVVEARDARSALSTLENGKDVDLLLTDIVMPGRMNGYELAQACRERLHDLPIVYTSGYSDAVVASSAGAGPDAPMLRKPYDKRQLSAVLEEILLSN
jgi:CheY-like chemotaxis protein